MQVIEKQADGLKREFNVVVTAATIEDKVFARLTEVGQQVRLPGFRPGKVPMDLLRKRFGQSVRGEVLERTIDESTQAALSERAIKPALQPKVELVSFEDGKDLEFAVKVEVLPEIAANDFTAIELLRETAQVDDGELEKALARLRREQSTTEPVGESRPLAAEDVAVVDFVGRIDGKPFDGGTAQGALVEIGSNSFIPGFEEQLIGATVGETRDVKVTFPADYPRAAVAGKEAVFEVKVNELRRRVVPEVDDALASKVGLENVEALRTRTRELLQRNFDQAARLRLKRRLLDRLAEGHSFPVPTGMVDAEFDVIWRQVEQAKKAGQLDAADVAKSDDELKAEYRGIAERRVRLGLLLSDVGQKNNLAVQPDELSRAIAEEARRYPGQENAVMSYYQNNPQALEALRAPLFEDKVVDFIITQAKVTDREIAPEELLKEPD